MSLSTASSNCTKGLFGRTVRLTAATSLVGWLAALFPAHAMPESELERRLGDVFDCRNLADLGWARRVQSPEFDAYMRDRSVKRPDGYPDDGKYRGDFPFFGTVFRDLLIAPGPGGSLMMALGDRPQADRVLLALRARGLTLKPGKPSFLGGVVDAHVLQVAHRGYVTEYIVIPARVQIVEETMEARAAGPGTTFVCAHFARASSSPDGKVADPSETEVDQVVRDQTPMPVAWANAVVARGSRLSLQRLAAYRHLQPAQVDALLALREFDDFAPILIASKADLSAKQIDLIISRGRQPDLDALALSRFDSLTELQRARVVPGVSDRARRDLTLKQGGAAADSLLMSMIETASDEDLRRALSQRMPNEQHVDLILTRRSPSARRALISEIMFAPTPAQIERLLMDPDPIVQIGLLRRRDVVLSQAQILRGLESPDRDLRFWYARREDFRPAPEQIERALSSPDADVRALWWRITVFTPTSAQIERALDDPNARVRAAILARKDVVLTPARLDQCLRSSEFSWRVGCIERPEFSINQARFEQLLLDTNPNVPARLIERARRDGVDLVPMIDVAWESGSESLLIALGSTRDLALQERHVTAGTQHASPWVRAAFCRRVNFAPATCRGL
jgi:hypothetical protein